ncbi:MAG TPA: hypothetical protein DEA44_06890 [Firmicutes bacterium]|nr:hypothetical protein [Bacillota bacterium]HWR56896.1 spore coat protein [Negativicutes bacterium]
MEKTFNEQALARMAIIHCKIAAAQLVTLATEAANPALRDQVQKALEANLQQQKRLHDAAFHAGFFPERDHDIHLLNLGDLIAPVLTENYEMEDL